MNRLFRNPWWIVFGSALGLTVGNGPVMQFSFGVFIKPLTAEFESNRGAISAGLTLGLCLTGLCTPIIGRLVDRYGVRRVALPAICLFSLALISLGFIPSNVWAFVAIYGVMGIFAAGQTPLPYAKAVSAAFDRKRGLALGITMAGVGVGTALLPQFAQHMIGSFGWRGAFIGMGVLLFVIAFPSVLLFLRDPVAERRAGVNGPLNIPGLSGGEALRNSRFWMMSVAFFIVSMVCADMLAHSIPIMTDRGISPQRAATAISIGGVAMIFGRLLSGWLLDRVFAPRVAVAFFLSPLVGLAMLFLTDGVVPGMVAVALIGTGLGAEVDLIAFLICRYLGLRSFGEIYGYSFLAFMVGSGLGPFLMGFCFAQTGSYSMTMAFFMASMVVAVFLVARLGPYRFDAKPALQPAPAAQGLARAGAD